jgi:hypothetical protein
MRVNEIADTLALKTIAAICDPSQLEVLHLLRRWTTVPECSGVRKAQVRMANDLCVQGRRSRSGLRQNTASSSL